MTDSDTQELVEALKSLSQEMANTTKILQAQVKVNEGKFESVERALVQRSIEDGVIANLDKASPEQLDRILQPHPKFFRYYHEIYDDICFVKVK
jgi:indole-3-glycerol phosphate synthase